MINESKIENQMMINSNDHMNDINDNEILKKKNLEENLSKSIQKYEQRKMYSIFFVAKSCIFKKKIKRNSKKSTI